MQEPRSHIEGATPVDGDLELRHRARSVHAAGPAPPILLNRRIPVERFLDRGTIEWHLDRVYRARRPDRKPRKRAKAAAQRAGRAGQPSSTRRSAAIRQELERVRSEYDGQANGDPTSSKAEAAQAEAGGNADEADRLRARLDRLHVAADHRRDDLQRLPDHQGQGRRAGLCRDPGDQPAHRHRVRGRLFADQGVLHQPRAAPRRRSWPARAGRCGSRSAA